MTDPTSAPATTPTDSSVAAVPAPVVEKTLQQFRAERAAPVEPTPAPVIEARSPLSGEPEPDEPPDEPETPLVTPDAAKGPEAAGHRWKDPDSGVTLDLRRRDHRRIKRLLEERSDLARRPAPQAPPQQQVQQPPQAQRQQPMALQPDPQDPEPQLEQYAEHADPYAAHARDVAKWEARQEFKRLSSERASVERTQRTQSAIASRQQAFDAELSKVRERIPGFDQAHDEVFDTLSRVPTPIRAPIIHRLLTGEHKHDLVAYLGNHPEDLHRLVTARSPLEQREVLGEVTASVKAALKAPPAPPVIPASAPMTPVGAGATSTAYNPVTADLAAYRAKHGVRGGRLISA